MYVLTSIVMYTAMKLKEEESTVEVEPEARPTLQATFKPAIPHVVSLYLSL